MSDDKLREIAKRHGLEDWRLNNEGHGQVIIADAALAQEPRK